MTQRRIIEWRRLWASFAVAGTSMAVYLLLAFMINGGGPFVNKVINLNSLFLYFSFVLIIYFVSMLFSQLQLSFATAAFSMYLYFFLLTWGMQGFIHFIFQTTVDYQQLFGFAVVISAVNTGMITVVLKPGHSGTGNYISEVKMYFRAHTLRNWAVRFVFAGLLMSLAYMMVTQLIFPFIEPYYEDANFLYEPGWTERMKLVAVMGHAALMFFVFLPVFALWKGSKTSLLFWIGFPLFLIVATQPFILFDQWPLGFRFPVFIHLTLTTYIQTIILVQLLYVSKDQDEEGLFPAFAWPSHN